MGFNSGFKGLIGKYKRKYSWPGLCYYRIYLEELRK